MTQFIKELLCRLLGGHIPPPPAFLHCMEYYRCQTCGKWLVGPPPKEYFEPAPPGPEQVRR